MSIGKVVYTAADQPGRLIQQQTTQSRQVHCDPRKAHKKVKTELCATPQFHESTECGVKCIELSFPAKDVLVKFIRCRMKDTTVYRVQAGNNVKLRPNHQYDN